MATLTRPVRIAQGSASDLDDSMQVMEAAFERAYGEGWTRSQCAGILPMAGVALVLARDCDSDEAVGFFLSRSVAEESELLLLAVSPERRREGIGWRLLDQFISRARLGGAVRVHLEVRAGNPATAMYKAAGFAPVGRRRNYYHGADGGRFDAVTLARDL